MLERSAVADAMSNGVSHHLLFERLVARCRERTAFPVAVSWPCSEVSFAGAVEAASAGISRPLLVGPELEDSPELPPRFSSIYAPAN